MSKKQKEARRILAAELFEQKIGPEPDWRLPAIRVSEGELFAIVVAGRVLRMQVGWLQKAALWIMQFGEKAEALQPPQLREMVCGRLAATVAEYSD